MCCQNSLNTFFLVSSVISLHSRFVAFLHASEVHLGPMALGCLVTISPSFLRLLTYDFPSILSCFCLFCFHFNGSATLALVIFLTAPALSKLVFPFWATVLRCAVQTDQKTEKHFCCYFSLLALEVWDFSETMKQWNNHSSLNPQNLFSEILGMFIGLIIILIALKHFSWMFTAKRPILNTLREGDGGQCTHP